MHSLAFSISCGFQSPDTCKALIYLATKLNLSLLDSLLLLLVKEKYSPLVFIINHSWNITKKSRKFINWCFLCSTIKIVVQK